MMYQAVRYVALLTLMLALGRAQPECPPDWTFSVHSGTCISLGHWSADWHHGRDICRSGGGDLVKIVNGQMNELIYGLVASDIHQPYWIGLNDIIKEGHYVWLDEHLQATYITWGPNHQNSSSQDCGGINQLGYPFGLWDDESCSAERKIICEKPLVNCPPGWSFSAFSSTCIKLIHEKADYIDSRDICNSEAADLLKISDPFMNEFIYGLVAPDMGEPYRIGLNDIVQEGHYVWLDEVVQAKYIPWAQNQPNNYQNQDCIEINHPGFPDGLWEDFDCSRERKFICEKPADYSMIW